MCCELHACANDIPTRWPDALIRLVLLTIHIAACLNIDLESAIDLKHRFNQTRSYRHGNKLA